MKNRNENPLKDVEIIYHASDKPITGNADNIIFFDHVNAITYIGECSEGITTLIIQNNNLVNMLKKFCCDVILFQALTTFFNLDYFDEKTGKKLSFIVKHIINSGIHLFYICTADEPDFLIDIPD